MYVWVPRSTKRLAQEQMEAAAVAESPRTPKSARGAEAAAADTAPNPINYAFKAVMEVLSRFQFTPWFVCLVTLKPYFTPEIPSINCTGPSDANTAQAPYSMPSWQGRAFLSQWPYLATKSVSE